MSLSLDHIFEVVVDESTFVKFIAALGADFRSLAPRRLTQVPRC